MTIKETETYYIDDLGRMIQKAEHHLARGECCFSYCLHCPYGTTVEKFKIQIEKINPNKIIFKLKGHPCAEANLLDKKITVYEKFKLQELDDELKLALDIFCKDKGGQ